MKNGRFFGTGVLILATAVICSCKARHESRGVIDPHQTKARVSEGNEKMTKAMQIGKELSGPQYEMRVQPDGKPENSVQSVHVETYDWNRFSREERQEVKAKLNEYIALLSQVLQVDAQKGVYVTEKEKILSWRESALVYQRALQNFEEKNGESFEPTKTPNQPQPVQNPASDSNKAS